MNLQEQELSELHQALTLHSSNNENENNFSQLAEKCVEHFQDDADKRSHLVHKDLSAFFAPAWCTNWENSLLWLAGCRPSQYIRLVFALCRLEIEEHLSEFLQDTSSSSAANLGYLASKQLYLINMLQGKTLRSEEKLTNKMASLQEEVADQPIVVIAKGLSQVGQINGEVDRALDKHEQPMVGILEAVDRLRLSTLKELVGILTPRQFSCGG